MAQTAQKLFGVQLSQPQLQELSQYEEMLLEWNTRFNLTAIDEVEKVRTKHFLDSLSCLPLMNLRPGNRIIDIGTGAGFPGLPIKIACPKVQLTLVESVGKKADFCRHVVNTLKLECVDVLTIRAEEVGRITEHREKYDWALARAVALMPILAEYLLPLVKIGGSMLAMKGENAPAETHRAERAFKLLGGILKKLQPVTLPGIVETRYLVIVQKAALTPAAFPRQVGTPAKKPL